MVQFCDTIFWDPESTWNTPLPDLSPCFQQTILVFVPCGFLFTWSAVEMTCIRPFQPPVRPPLLLTLLHLAKLVNTGLLIFLALAQMAYFILYPLPPSFFTSVIAKLLAFVLCLRELGYDRGHGNTFSSKLCLFWLLMSVSSLVQFYSMVLRIFNLGVSPPEVPEDLVMDTVYHSLIFSMCALSAFHEISIFHPAALLDAQKRHVFQRVSLFSFLTFSWMDKLTWTGFRSTISADKLEPLPPHLLADRVHTDFDRAWKKQNGTETQPRMPSLMKSLVRAFWFHGFIANILELIYSFTRFIPPLVLNLLLTHMARPKEPPWRGHFYALLLLVGSIISGAATQHENFHSLLMSMQIKAALISTIYHKSLHLSSQSRSKYTMGELVNLMSVDAAKIYNLSKYLVLVWSAPFRIALSIALLWKYLGPACLAAIAIMLAMMPVSLAVAAFSKRIQEKQMVLKDQRIKIINEILNGIKVLKFYAWENAFMDLVTGVRDKEVHLLKQYSYINAATSFLWGITPFVIAVSSFVTYVMLDKRNVLDASTAFVSLTLLNMLRFSLLVVPDLISTIVQTRVSINRICVFLNCEELQPEAIGCNPIKDNSIAISRASFSWGNDFPALKKIDLNVAKGSLVAIIGQVGSGKSSLLSAILGEMNKLTGNVDRLGTVAYVAQQAWIQNATVKQNILFLQPYHTLFYQRVLDACGLLPDLAIMPGRDLTEIGEKGVNLSGGQKHRISLARAVYQNKDIYLLDDPLSAVDAHMGKHIFQKVIGHQGLLKNKTRVLVTHQLSVLPEADLIVIVDRGEILEMGTYQQLKSSKFLTNLLQNPLPLPPSPQESLRVTASILSDHLLQGSSSSRMSLLEHALLVEEEQLELGKVKLSVYHYYSRNAGYTMLATSLIFLALFQVFEISSNLWLSRWSEDRPLPDGSQDTALRNKRIWVYSVLGVSEGGALLAGGLFLAAAAMSASRRLHLSMLTSILHAPMSFFDVTPLGRILNRFGKDVDSVDTEIPLIIDGYLNCLLPVVGTVVIIGLANSYFLAVLLPVAGIYYLIQKLYVSSSRQLMRLESASRSPIYAHFSETLAGLATLRAFQAQSNFLASIYVHLDRNLTCFFYIVSSNRWLGFRLEMLGSLITYLVAVIAITTRGSMASGTLGLALSYAFNVTELFTWLVRLATTLESNIVSAERIKEYSSVTPEAPWEIPSWHAPRETWPDEGRVEFHRYSTRYRPGLDLVLREVDLEVEPRTKVGIVGRTGAGKSSLTLALFRIVEPAGGTIIIDGVDVSTLGLHQLRSHLTIIPQDPVLFTGTLRTNLDPQHAYTESQVWRAIELAHLKFDVTHGLDFEVEEGGQNLSVGQRQQVCLARALLKKSQILILDEATAAVDMETDRLIQRTIRKEFQSCTILTIAHRLHTIIDYDRVVVMAKGQIIEDGHPLELINDASSHFHSLARDAGLLNQVPII